MNIHNIFIKYRKQFKYIVMGIFFSEFVSQKKTILPYTGSNRFTSLQRLGKTYRLIDPGTLKVVDLLTNNKLVDPEK